MARDGSGGTIFGNVCVRTYKDYKKDKKKTDMKYFKMDCNGEKPLRRMIEA